MIYSAWGLDGIANTFVEAFVKRANEVHGTSNA